jgi:uncharacterized protein involved in exopolysaccharide biosynthesis
LPTNVAEGEQELSEPGEVTVRDLLQDIWRLRFRLVAVALLGAALGLAWGLTTDRLYQASTLLSPVLDDGSGGRLGGLGSIASQYGGLASLAGINVSGGGKKEEAIAVLQSQLLTERYIKEANLLPILFADKWDASAGQWKSTAAGQVPTVWAGNRYFRTSIRQVTSDAKTGLVVLSIKWKDPKLAASWANDLVRLTNEYLRDKAIDESQRNIRYLNAQANQASAVEIRRAIYSLLEDELNREMVARGRAEFALKTVDPAFVPEKPSSLGPITLAILGLLAGGLFAVIGVFAVRVIRY